MIGAVRQIIFFLLYLFSNIFIAPYLKLLLTCSLLYMFNNRSKKKCICKNINIILDEGADLTVYSTLLENLTDDAIA